MSVTDREVSGCHLAVLATDLPDWQEGLGVEVERLQVEAGGGADLWYSGGQADPALVGAVPALQPGQLHRQQVQPERRFAGVQ